MTAEAIYWPTSSSYTWDRPAWYALRACGPDTAHLFFEPAQERPERRVERESLARAICHTCPAMTECRTYGRVNREHGFWGGETEEERIAAGFIPEFFHRSSLARLAKTVRREWAARGEWLP